MVTWQLVKRLECNTCPGPGGCSGIQRRYHGSCYRSSPVWVCQDLHLIQLNQLTRKEDIETVGRAVVKRYWSLVSNHPWYLDSWPLKMPSLCNDGSRWFNNATLRLAIAMRLMLIVLEDFDTIQNVLPHLADLKPSGQYVFQDLYEVGGCACGYEIPLGKWFPCNDRITCTSKTVAEQAGFADLTPGQKVIMPWKSKRAGGPAYHQTEPCYLIAVCQGIRC